MRTDDLGLGVYINTLETHWEEAEPIEEVAKSIFDGQNFHFHVRRKKCCVCHDLRDNILVHTVESLKR